jgi:hypothetical protein
MYQPMPSPNGTNHEQLFIRDRNPVAAYDAAPPRLPRLVTAADGERYARRWLARRGMAYDAPEDASESDQNEILSPEYLKILLDWAKKADLDYEQWEKFNEILKAISDPNGDYIDGSYVSGNAQDARRRATGLPRTALDGQPRREMTMAEKQRFDLMFPGVSRLKIL